MKKEYYNNRADQDLFVFQLSQELNTHVRQVKSFAMLLVNSVGDLNEQQHEYVAYLNESTHTLESKLNALTAYSRIKLNKHFLTQCHFSDMLEEHCKVFKIRYPSFTYAIHSAAPFDVVNIDTHLFSLVILELLSNAVNFCGQPSLHLNINLTSDDRYLVCYFHDNGDGVPEYLKENVFQVFNKGEHFLDTNGPGIGLSKVKKILVLHGGEVAMEQVCLEPHQKGIKGQCYPVLKLPFATTSAQLSDVTAC